MPMRAFRVAVQGDGLSTQTAFRPVLPADTSFAGYYVPALGQYLLFTRDDITAVVTALTSAQIDAACTLWNIPRSYLQGA